jgi:N-acetylneuraminic acid mutarotase
MKTAHFLPKSCFMKDAVAYDTYCWCAGIEMGEGSMNDLYSFDSKSGVWSKLDTKGSPPEARSFHAMVAVGSTLYVFGGCGKGGRLNDLHLFDTAALEWLQMPSSSDIKVRPHNH